MKDFTSIKTNIPVLGNNVIPTLWNVYQEKNPTTIPTKEKSCKNLKIYSKFLFYHSFKKKKYIFQLSLGIYREIPDVVTSQPETDIHSG